MRSTSGNVAHYFEDYVEVILNDGETVLMDTADYEKIKTGKVFISNNSIQVRYNYDGQYKYKNLIVEIFKGGMRNRRLVYFKNNNELDFRKCNLTFFNSKFERCNDGTVFFYLGDQKVLIDEEDIDIVEENSWYLSKNGYVISKHPKATYLHKLLSRVSKDEEVDHIDVNKLNNRKSNLRICNHNDNCYNRKKYKSGRFVGVPLTSKYKGVSFRKGTWDARIKRNGEEINLGSYKTELAAASAYNYFATIYHGEYAELNDIPFYKDWYLDRGQKSSPYIGVSKEKKRWKTRFEGKIIGYFPTEKQAAMAFNEKAIAKNYPLHKLNIVNMEV